MCKYQYEQMRQRENWYYLKNKKKSTIPAMSQKPVKVPGNTQSCVKKKELKVESKEHSYAVRVTGHRW